MDSPIIPPEVLKHLKIAYEADDPTSDDGAPGRMARLLKIAELTGECMELCQGDETLARFIMVAAMSAYVDHLYCDEAGLDEKSANFDLDNIIGEVFNSVANLNEVVRIPPIPGETSEQTYYRGFCAGIYHMCSENAAPNEYLAEALAKAEDSEFYKPLLDKVEDVEEKS